MNYHKNEKLHFFVILKQNDVWYSENPKWNTQLKQIIYKLSTKNALLSDQTQSKKGMNSFKNKFTIYMQYQVVFKSI